MRPRPTTDEGPTTPGGNRLWLLTFVPDQVHSPPSQGPLIRGRTEVPHTLFLRHFLAFAKGAGRMASHRSRNTCRRATVPFNFPLHHLPPGFTPPGCVVESGRRVRVDSNGSYAGRTARRLPLTAVRIALTDKPAVAPGDWGGTIRAGRNSLPEKSLLLFYTLLVESPARQ